MNILDTFKQKAKQAKQRIVLPEGMDDRTLVAADRLNREELASVILLGSPEAIGRRAAELNLDLSRLTIIDPSQSEKLFPYANLYYERMKSKGHHQRRGDPPAQESALLWGDDGEYGRCRWLGGRGNQYDRRNSPCRFALHWLERELPHCL